MIAPERILVIRLSALGDVLLAGPAVRALARHFPNARIDWLVEADYIPLVGQARGLPLQSRFRAVAYEKRGRHAGIGGLLALHRELAAQRYDLVVDLQNKPKTRVFHSLAPSCLAWHKRTPSQALLALAGREKPLTRAHAIDLYFEPLGIPVPSAADDRALELHLAPEHYEQARAVVPEGRVAAIAPSARWANKRWPAERFGELLLRLKQREFAPLLIAGPGDVEVLAAVRGAACGTRTIPDTVHDVGAQHAAPCTAAPTTIPDTAKLGVGGLAAAIARSTVVIANDSGPVHLASALKIPVVAIFGPTSPERWRPRSQRAEVVRLDSCDCSPCSNHGGDSCPLGHHRCLREISVEAVLAAVDRVSA